MRISKLGTRLTLMLLLCLAPAAIAAALVTARSAAVNFSQEMMAQTRLAQRAMNASLTPDVEQQEWDEIQYIITAVGQEELEAALLDRTGRVRFELAGFPIAPPPLTWIIAHIRSGGGSAEFMGEANGRRWFCRIEPLGIRSVGYLMVVRDWTALGRFRDRRIATSLVAIGGLLLVVTVTIPLLVKRYVSQPLAELQAHIAGISSDGRVPSARGGDEVSSISAEFQRVYRQLEEARDRLWDESERKLQLERRLRQADKLATIGTLASGLAHEIGTPLGVIRGRAELLLSRSHDEKLNEGLKIVIEQIDRIASRVRTMLDLGRRSESVRCAVDLRSVVQDTVSLLEGEAARRGIAVSADLGSTPLPVDCDPHQMQQVFVNLMINAFDAMDGTGGKLRISGGALPNGEVRLGFDDTGPGIPPQLRERIFDPFFTTKEPGKGTGMGLAVSQSIIIDHGGDLVLEPAAVGGAGFSVRLPMSGAGETGRPPSMNNVT